MKFILHTVLTIVLLSTGVLNAQDNNDYYSDKTLHYTNRVYENGIASVILTRTDDELAPPYFDLDADESVTLHFDDLIKSNVRSFNYSLIHCNINWEPSGLLEMEYLSGFYQGNITQYEASFNTRQSYYHYQLQVPNDNMKITLAGNYILFVYEDNDKSKPILTQRFIAYQSRVSINYEFKRPDNPENRNYLQQTNVTIMNNQLQLTRNSDLKVMILQNNRWDNAVQMIEPNFIRNNELVYMADDDHQFNGGSEFRQLDIRNLNIKSNNVMAITSDSSMKCAYLYTDERRSNKRYVTTKDANGKFIILRDNSDDPHVQADYVWVFFRLATGEAIKEGNVYVYGSFNGWQLGPENKMVYNEETGDYSAAIKMKQGYYNYLFMVSKDGKNVPDDTLLEGTHFDTENDYTIIVYHRDLKKNTDIPVGLVKFNTHNN